MSRDLQIFVLSFGRSKVPTLKHIANKEDVIVLTSNDNKFKDEIELQGAKLLVFDKDEFKGRGLEMLNDESVPHRMSAVYGYNYAIEWGRRNGVRYVLVLDDDYAEVYSINDRTYKPRPRIDKWAMHVVRLMKKQPIIGATSAINLGQLFSGCTSAYYLNISKRQLMNTILFDTKKKHYFISLGNGDYVTQALMNSASRDLIVRTNTIAVQTETIKMKKHDTIDYSNLFYARWAIKMANPAYSEVRILNGGKGIMKYRFNTIWRGNSAPKIISL